MYKLDRIVLLSKSQLHQKLFLHRKVVVERLLQTLLLFLARFQSGRNLRCTVNYLCLAVRIAVLSGGVFNFKTEI